MKSGFQNLPKWFRTVKLWSNLEISLQADQGYLWGSVGLFSFLKCIQDHGIEYSKCIDKKTISSSSSWPELFVGISWTFFLSELYSAMRRGNRVSRVKREENWASKREVWAIVSCPDMLDHIRYSGSKTAAVQIWPISEFNRHVRWHHKL